MFQMNGVNYVDPDAPLAAKFLDHATIGYTEEMVRSLSDRVYRPEEPKNYLTWINAQISVQDVPIRNTHCELYPGLAASGLDPRDPSVSHYRWVGLRYGWESKAVRPDDGVDEFSFSPAPFIASFVRKAISTKEVLRLKMAYALSQIIVVSGTNGLTDDGVYFKIAGFFDILHKHAFSSYEDLLWEVSKSAAMGEYLTFLGSEKGSAGRSPDENYARELMQLFTIGPVALDPQTGDPVAKWDDAKGAVVRSDAEGGQVVFHDSYDGMQVHEAARVFTGWLPPLGSRPLEADWNAYRGVTEKITLCNGVERTVAGNNLLKNDPEKHDSGRVELNFSIPTNSGENRSYQIVVEAGGHEARIKSFIRQLVRHPNAAFFVARSLIQRFTTSNPSADYVRRVAEAFRVEVDVPDGSGGTTKKIGDLGRVVKAILLDKSLFLDNPAYSGGLERAASGVARVRDPFSRLMQWAIGMGAVETGGVTVPVSGSETLRQWFGVSSGFSKPPIYAASRLGQAPMCAPSVFNFYRPGYVSSSVPWVAKREITVRGTKVYIDLVAPEMQIINSSSVLAYAEFMREAIDPDRGIGGFGNVVARYENWIADAINPGILLDRLILVLSGGRFAPLVRSKIVDFVKSMPSETDSDKRERVQMAVYLLMVSPDYLVQR